MKSNIFQFLLVYMLCGNSEVYSSSQRSHQEHCKAWQKNHKFTLVLMSSDGHIQWTYQTYRHLASVLQEFEDASYREICIAHSTSLAQALQKQNNRLQEEGRRYALAHNVAQSDLHHGAPVYNYPVAFWADRGIPEFSVTTFLGSVASWAAWPSRVDSEESVTPLVGSDVSNVASLPVRADSLPSVQTGSKVRVNNPYVAVVVQMRQ